MLENKIIYDCITGETRVEEAEIPDIPEEPILPQEPTIEEKVAKLESNSVDMIATSWDMDFRICEIEWFLEDTIPNPVSKMGFSLNNIKNTKGGNNMALSRSEQAKIMILGGAYNRVTLTRQLDTYLKRGYITQEEYDILISMMDAKEIVADEIK